MSETLLMIKTNTAARVETYKLTASGGKHIRTATKVTFANGRVIEFTERISKREALRQALSIR